MNDIQYFRTFAIIEEGQPDIPKNYVVRVVLAEHYDAALAREAALREELAEVKRHVKNADMVFDLLRIACQATGETTALVYSKLGDMLNAKAEAEALQQRLTVAEQGLRTIIKRCQAGWSTEAIELEAEEALEDIALKPAAEGEGS